MAGRKNKNRGPQADPMSYEIQYQKNSYTHDFYRSLYKITELLTSC